MKNFLKEWIIAEIFVILGLLGAVVSKVYGNSFLLYAILVVIFTILQFVLLVGAIIIITINLRQ